MTDDGIDRGSLTDVNDEFKVLGPAGASRVVYVYNYTSDPLADSGDGHGNINASIVGGYNALTGTAYEDANGYNYGLGICPFVQLGAIEGVQQRGQRPTSWPTPCALCRLLRRAAPGSAATRGVHQRGNDLQRRLPGA